MKIIGLAGKARSGKDTVAKFFTAEGYSRLAFADELKKITARTFGHKLNEYHTDQKEERYPETLNVTQRHLDIFAENISYKFPVSLESIEKMSELAGKGVNSHRELLQFMGTDLARNCIDQEIWTTIYIAEAEKLGKVVTPDARFYNERRLIERLGGKNILIHRPGVEIEAGDHISENELGEVHEYDHVICNEGSLEQLQEKVQIIILEDE